MRRRSSSILLAAADDGPKSALQPLSRGVGAVLADTAVPEAAEDAYWTRLIRSHFAPGVVCGTSDTPRGREIESAARRAAAGAGVPAVAIEDFPGNYYDVSGGNVSLLVVESDAVVQFTRAKLGVSCPRAVALSPARYDSYRANAKMLRAQLAARWANAREARSILWAGQPETADCVRTLEIVLPLAQAREASVLFKAHPRDEGYRSGAYRALLAASGVSWRDVTSLTVPDALLHAPHLVVTQFSSVAVEAGFYGIPSLCVLFANAGGARLASKKGYPVPPFCECGAAAAVTGTEALAQAFSDALCDQVRRENILRCFDAYFRTGTPMLPELVARLESVFGIGQISP